MSESFLEEIVEYKRGIIEEKKDYYNSLKEKACKLEHPNLFKQAICSPGQVNLIAEVKKASPSKGVIREQFDPVEIAKTYQEQGAAAISVLTEDKYFLGSPEYIKNIHEAVDIPILTKDFILDEGQIYEALANGASAILLITAILDDEMLSLLNRTAMSLGMDCLFEVHSVGELSRACNAGAKIIGVNNRNLKSFNVDVNTCIELVPKIPIDKVIVAESGYHSNDQIKELYGLGVNAVLIGEAFMKEDDIGAKVKEVMRGSH